MSIPAHTYGQWLAADLKAEFGEKSGFSAQNLWYMRQFYDEYKDLPNLQPLAGEISWTKHTVILAKCKAPLEREFYLRSTARFPSFPRFALECRPGCSASRVLGGTIPRRAKRDAERLRMRSHAERSSLYTSPVKPRKAVISAWMPKYRPRMVSSRLHKCLIQSTCQPVVSCHLIRRHLSRLRVCHPWTLDFGIHAEMTSLLHLCMTTSAERGNDNKTAQQPFGIATYSLTPHLPDSYRKLLPGEDEIAARLAGWMDLDSSLSR